MKDDQRNYILVGTFVLAMITGLILWIALLSGGTGATDTYHIRYGDVLGLTPGGTQVYYDGFPVGKIEVIERDPDGDGQEFRLDVSIARGWEIPEDSVAKITASGLLAAVVINIEGGDSDKNLSPGDRIRSAEAANLMAEAANLMAVTTKTAAGFSDFLLDTLEPQIEGIVGDLSQTMMQVNDLVSPQNIQRIASILQNLERVSQQVEAMTAGLDGTRHRLDSVLAQAGSLIEDNEDELSQSIVDLHESLEAVARHADAIAHNLEATTRNMNEFSQQIRENPGVVIRGRSAASEPQGSN
ncbi:MAG: MlaD family protein [Myxococcota bacterium]